MSRPHASLKELRQHRGFTLERLAFESGLSVSAVHRAECGVHWPTPSTLEKLAGTLDTTPEEIERLIGATPEEDH
jgi:transcriptional regulator with XRE-family HTH domain